MTVVTSICNVKSSVMCSIRHANKVLLTALEKHFSHSAFLLLCFDSKRKSCNNFRKTDTFGKVFLIRLCGGTLSY